MTIQKKPVCLSLWNDKFAEFNLHQHFGLDPILLSAMNGKNISTYAFGDQNNDLSMFSKVDYGIAMKQATRELKQKASYVAQTDFGVVEGLKYYHLV